jgi:predicted  nucleic acid-binding Zn-ribbon protein
MGFDAAQTNQQISDSIGSMLLLNASCQALIEVSIAPSSSPWYPQLDEQLGQAQDLVVGWRQNGYRYFQSEILAQVDACGKTFLAAQASIDALFEQLQGEYDSAVQARIVNQLEALQAPVQGMLAAIAGYSARLAAFEQQLGEPYARMNTSIAQIQAQEADIQQQIGTINQQIQQLQQQVQADRDAIAKARAQKTRGFVETVFGVLLTPFTAGLSLVLAGIGVATLAQAQEKIDALQSTISQYQGTISADQQALSADQQQVATLNGLTMSLSLAINDIDAIDTALDALKVSWTVLAGELGNATSAVAKARDAQQAIVARVWFDAACNSWRTINDFVESMQANNAPVPKRVAIGQ